MKKSKKIKKNKRQWFVAYFPQGYRKKLEKCFEKYKDSFKDVEMWYPQREIIKVKKGKKAKGLEPLYPGYVLFEFDPNDRAWTRIIRLTPVFGFIKDLDTNKPIPLTEEEVERIKQVETKTFIVNYNFLLKKKVLIIGGPFESFVGTCKALIKGRNTAKIELELINSLVREVEVSLEQIEVLE